MHDVRPRLPSSQMRDVRNLKGAEERTVDVTHYYRVNKPLKLRDHNCVIVMDEK